MADYDDKDFKDKYEEIVDLVQNLTTKWDPSVADESDPGVVFLKTLAFLTDKIDYRINYRNAQNSVRDVTDRIEGERLFADLGYQVKNQKSATGELSVKYLGDSSIDDADNDYAVIDLFTEFSNTSGSLVYSSVSSYTTIKRGETKLIKVQEGTVTRYTYDGVSIFNTDNLTNNLRLPIVGMGELAENGIIISTDGDYNLGLFADWLNVGDYYFNSVETNNLFSVGKDPDGTPYVQFYEESLAGLSKGVGIWVISSSGAAGNIGRNKINRISSEISVGNTSNFSITHNEFINGQDEESLESAKNNYYDSFGVNDTLVSERDYKEALKDEVGPTLNPIFSQALITDVSGRHNLVEIVSLINDSKDVTMVRLIQSPPISHVFVNALTYTDDYYESFKFLVDEETERLLLKSIFETSIVSNDLALVNKENEQGEKIENESNLYDRFLFDIVTAMGTVVINSTDSVDDIRDDIISVLKNNLNSRYLVVGEMLSESTISSLIKENINGVQDVAVYYKEHKISKTADDPENPTDLTDEEKEDIVARSVLRGDTQLFSENNLTLCPGANAVTYYPSKEYQERGAKIIRIRSTIGGSSFEPDRETNTSATLTTNEIVQFYSVAQEESDAYGYGIKYRLLAHSKVLDEDTTVTSTSVLTSGCVIAAGSIIYSAEGINYEEVEAQQPGTLDESKSDYDNHIYYFAKNYTVVTQITVDANGSNSVLKAGTIFVAVATLNEKEYAQVFIPNDTEFDLALNNCQLVLQTSDSTIILPNSDTTVIKPSGFSAGGIYSDGDIGSGMGTGGTYMTGETITGMVESSSTATSKHYYGLILNAGKTKVELSGGESYFLEDGEHLIFSDENLLDFIDFGSGTLLSAADDSDLILDNIISYDSEDFTQDLTKFPGEVKISNTNIYTFTEGDKVSYLPKEVGITSDWTKLTATVTMETSDGTSMDFDASYHVRGGLIIHTGVSNTMTLTGTDQVFEITYQFDDGHTETETIAGGTETRDSPTIICFSTSLYVNAIDLEIDPEDDLQLVSYWLSVNNEGASTTMEYDRGSGFYLMSTLSSSSGTINWFLAEESLYYLVKVNLNISEGGSVTFSQDGDSSKELKILNTTETVVGPGTYQILLYALTNSGNHRLIITFEGCSEGDTIEIVDFKNITDLNPDLGYESDDESQNYSVGFSNDQGTSLFNKINEYIENNGENIVPFDFFYSNESFIKSPTMAENYYDPEHILNRSILTVLDIEKFEDNLVIRRKT